ncbi:MAG: hypothetical protein AAFV19_06965 [Pseudomonadota bacterium]
MTDDETIARHLLEAWRAKTPHANLSGDLAPDDLDHAYRVQGQLQDLFVVERGPLVGRKIALSSKPMQQMIGIDHPIAGAFFVRDVHQSPARVSGASFGHMGLECELALELGADADAPEAYTPESAGELVSAARPAFELIEDRGADYAALDVLSLAADNAWCGGVVLGPVLPGFDIAAINDMPAQLSQPGQPDEDAVTGAADPLGSLAWVLNHFRNRGNPVKKGESVITGSVVRTRFPVAGDRFRYEIAGTAVELEIT